MGYNANLNALDRYEQKNRDEMVEHFTPILVGKKIEYFLGAEVIGYHIQGSVYIEGEGYFDSHYCWSSEFNVRGNEENMASMNYFYKEYLIGKTITHVELGGWDRDDYIYLYAYVSKDSYLEIPVISVDEIFQEEFYKQTNENLHLIKMNRTFVKKHRLVSTKRTLF